MELTFKRCTSADIDALEKFGATNIKSILVTEGVIACIALDGNKVVGFLRAHSIGDPFSQKRNVYIDTFKVDPKYSESKIRSGILSEIGMKLIENDINKIYFIANGENYTLN